MDNLGVDIGQIAEHAEIVGADGVHVGTVDKVEGGRIKLTKADSGGAGFGGGHESHHHYIPLSLVSGVDDGGRVRLSANGAVAVTFEEEEGGSDIAGRGDDATGMAAETARETAERASGPDGDAVAPGVGGTDDNRAFFSDTPSSNAGEGLAGGGGTPGSTAIDSNGGEFAQERKAGYRSGGV